MINCTDGIGNQVVTRKRLPPLNGSGVNLMIGIGGECQQHCHSPSQDEQDSPSQSHS